MARGGFIASKVALSKVALKCSGRTRLAREALIHGLVSGNLIARGNMLVEPRRSTDRKSDNTVVTMAVYDGDVTEIPAEFWQNAERSDHCGWNFTDGVFAIQPWDGEIPQEYTSVEFKETTVNQLIKSLEKRLEPRLKKERRRRAEWNEWIAALAVLIADGRITAASQDSDLSDEIDKKLISWGFDEVSPSTFQAARKEVLKRLKDAEASIRSRQPDLP